MTTEKDTTKAKKKPKKQGPIRFAAIGPIALVGAGAWAYGYFLMDSHIRMGLEFASTQLYGAEVNIGKFKIDYTAPGIHIGAIEVTNKDDPKLNIVQVGDVELALLWDSILRAKVVVEKANVLNIETLTPRKKPGKIIPPSEDGGLSDELKKKLVESAKEKVQGSVLGDIAQTIEGADPRKQLEGLKAELKTDKKILELKTEMANKQKEWKQKIDELPSAKTITELSSRAKSVKIDSPSPKAIAAAITALTTIKKDAETQAGKFTTAQQGIRTDIATFKGDLASVETMIEEDIKGLQNKLKIPNLDIGEMSKNLFQDTIDEKMASVQKYVDMGRKYMPAKKAGEEKEPEFVPHPRGVGKTYKFPVTVGYPLFWLKESKITSKSNHSEYSGDLNGVAKNFTSDPKYIGKAATVNIDGNFPGQKIYGLKADFNFDHTGEEPIETLTGSIGSHPVTKQVFSNTNDVKFIMTEALGRIDYAFEIQNENIQANIKNSFNKTKYEVAAKSAVVDEALKSVIGGLPDLYVNTKITGHYRDPKLAVSSNLGNELAKGFKQHLDKKVAEAKERLNNFVNEKVAAKKAELYAEYDKVKGQFDSQLNAKKQEVDNAVALVKNTVDSKKSEFTDKKNQMANEAKAKLDAKKKAAKAAADEKKRKANEKAKKKADEQKGKALKKLGF